MNFQEADLHYVDLKQQYDNGSLSAEEFEAQLEQLMVHDEEDRWWSKHPETGEWHYYDGDTWVRDVPPAYEKDIPEVTTKEAPTETSSVPYPDDINNGKDRRQRVLPRVPAAAALIGVVAIAGIGVVVWLLLPLFLGDDNDFPAAATVTLRDVVGMSQAEAEEALRADGHKVTVETQESSLKERGIVVEQSPPGGDEAEESSTVAVTVGKGLQPASGYAVVENISGKLAVEVPSNWSDTIIDKEGTLKGEDVEPGEGIGPAITATTDLDAWEDANRLGVSGVYILASRELASYTEDELLDSRLADLSSCKHGTRQSFDRAPYSGKMQWSECGEDGDNNRLTLAAAPANRECTILVQAVTYSEADREAARHILNTFEADCRGIS
jgi:hypothetical protein